MSVEHQDKLGRVLKVGDCVAYPSHNSLGIGTIAKLTPKMVGVVRVGAKSTFHFHKYPKDLVLLEGQDVTLYLLKHTGG